MKVGAKKASLLPTELSEPSLDMGDYITLIYGREKIGKTTLAAQFPEALFLGFEPGTKALRVYNVPIPDWEQARAVLKELKKSPKKFQTVIIDTVDLAYKICQNYTCRMMNIEHPADGDFGKGWSAVKDAFTNYILELQGTGRGVVLLSHATEKDYTGLDGRSSTRIIPSMPKGAREVLEPMLDIWLYYHYLPGGKRELRLRADDMVTSGTRVKEGFQGVESIDCGTSAEEAYANLQSAFLKGSQS